MIENEESKFAEANITSDKISHHGYHRFYPTFLYKFKDVSNIKILELGYESGHSIQLWKNYFKNPIIHSIDIIEDPKDPKLDAYFNVDQSNNEMLDSFCKCNTTKYQFIIDDASHIPDYQWNTFIRFVDMLSEGGVYIIEDIETSFWGISEFFGYEFDSHKTSILQKIEAIYHIINNEFISWDIQKKYGLSDLEVQALSQIETLTIAYNCLIFTKKDNSKYSRYYRTYEQYRFNNEVDKLKKKKFSKLNVLIKKLFKKIFFFTNTK
jgi:hypothetical protein